MNVYRVSREGYMLVAANSESEACAKLARWEDVVSDSVGRLSAELQSENVPAEDIEAAEAAGDLLA